MKIRTKQGARWSGLLAVAVQLTACGGGSDDPTTQPTPAPTPPPTAIQKGIEGVGIVTQFGASFSSVTVGETTYDASDSALTVTVDNQVAMLSDINVGNIVSVVATTADEGVTAVATSITQINDLEGPIEAGSIDLQAGTFVVLGQTVQIVATTLFDDDIVPRSIEGLSDGFAVEVSGLFDANGVFVATRVDDDDDAGDFEITGTVSSLDGATLRFNIGPLVVDYSTATLEDFTAGMPTDGDLVEVYATSIGAAGELIATRVENKTFDFDGDDGDFGELEGFVTRFDSATDFDVQGVPVTTTANTVFDDGTATDLALGVRVEVDGTLDANGVLVATRVDFEDDENDSEIEIDARVDAIDAVAGTLEVLGLSVAVTSATVLEDSSDADLQPFDFSDVSVGDYVELVVAARSLSLEALVLERDDDDDESSVRGPLDAIAEPQLTILGVTIETTAQTEFELLDDVPTTPADFFASVQPGSIVKADGTWNGTALVAEEVELED